MTTKTKQKHPVERLAAWYWKRAGAQAPWGKVTQENCARQIGVGFSTFHLWIHGKKAPRSATMNDAIIKFLKTNEG